MIDLSFPMREIELFLLILVRVSCFIYTAPFYSLNNVPKRVKIGLSFFIAMLLYQVLIPYLMDFQRLMKIFMKNLKKFLLWQT